MYCQKCGNELRNDAKFCDKCGEAVNCNKSGGAINNFQSQSFEIQLDFKKIPNKLSELFSQMKLTNISLTVFILTAISILCTLTVPYAFIYENRLRTIKRWAGMFYGDDSDFLYLGMRRMFGVILIILSLLVVFSALLEEYKLSVNIAWATSISNFVFGLLCCWSTRKNQLYSAPFWGVLITTILNIIIVVYLNDLRSSRPHKGIAFLNSILSRKFEKIKWTSCGIEASGDDEFCSVCEKKPNDKLKCPICGFEVNADADFCSACGNKLKQ